jgi:hypothetical protein
MLFFLYTQEGTGGDRNVNSPLSYRNLAFGHKGRNSSRPGMTMGVKKILFTTVFNKMWAVLVFYDQRVREGGGVFHPKYPFYS